MDVSSPSRGKKKNERGSSSPSPPPFSSPRDSLPPSASPSPFSPILAPSDSPLSASPLSNSPSESPLEVPVSSPSQSPSYIFMTPSITPILAPAPASIIPANPPIIVSAPTDSHWDPNPSSASTPSPLVNKNYKTKNHVVLILVGIIGGCLFILLSVIGIVFCRSNKVVSVRPWATGLSGQLQKAFVTGHSSCSLEKKILCII